VIRLFLLAASAGQLPEGSVPHTGVPCWTGERTWSAPGEPPSNFVAFDTERDAVAVNIDHNRDQYRDRGAIAQDYNFLDYRFASRPALYVRVYLDNPSTVLVHDGTTQIRALADLRAAAGDEIVCYLQKRFEAIETPTENRGYQPVWRARSR
jgi:hypothetical protein